MALPATPSRHPRDEALMDYAAGGASPGASLLLATHLTFCPECRARVAMLEEVGGAMVESLAPADIDSAARAALMARLDETEWHVGSRGGPPDATPTDPPAIRLPTALRARVGDLATVAWQPVLSGVDQFILERGPDGACTRLMRIRAGRAVPQHGHRGLEMVCVLDGGFTDSAGRYGPGDVAVADESVDHRPTADADSDCICLAVTEAPVRLTGRWWRLLNPFVRF